jgi:hypothetical protein
MLAALVPYMIAARLMLAHVRLNVGHIRWLSL